MKRFVCLRSLQLRVGGGRGILKHQSSKNVERISQLRGERGGDEADKAVVVLLPNVISLGQKFQSVRS